MGKETGKNRRLKILMAAAEAAPFAKVGGLADVVGSLPPALKRLGVDVRLVLPRYGVIDRRRFGLKRIYRRLEVYSGRRLKTIDIYEGSLGAERVPVYFIDEPGYFGGREIYLKNDNSERYLFFSLALLAALPAIGFAPDLIHCHDFHVGLVPDLLHALPYEYLKNIKTAYTIHNLNYQGRSPVGVLSAANLKSDSLALLAADAKDGDINFMVQGILGADAVNTVSPTYAREIKTAFYGADLDNVIRKRRDLTGILNGIDTGFYDPRTDPHIARHYTARSLKDRAKNKRALQRLAGLPADGRTAVVGLVARLFWQKGIDLITEDIMNLDCRFVCLGQGEPLYENHILKLARKYPRRFAASIGFNLKLAQLIYAGADIFLMPSRYEPCGLGQMFAMRYGAVPVARATGGLADTIGKPVGFTFTEISPYALIKTLKKALYAYYHQPKTWRRLQQNGMKKDFSWKKSARAYIRLYQETLEK